MKLFYFAIIFTLFFPSSLLACSCISPATIEEHIDGSEVIFVGKAFRTRPTLIGLHHSNPNRLTKFRVLEKMKGVESDVIVIFHNKFTGMDCGLNFEKNENYIVFASAYEADRLVTSICDLTRNTRALDSEELDAYRAALGKS